MEGSSYSLFDSSSVSKIVTSTKYSSPMLCVAVITYFNLLPLGCLGACMQVACQHRKDEPTAHKNKSDQEAKQSTTEATELCISGCPMVLHFASAPTARVPCYHEPWLHPAPSQTGSAMPRALDVNRICPGRQRTPATSRSRCSIRDLPSPMAGCICLQRVETAQKKL